MKHIFFFTPMIIVSMITQSCGVAISSSSHEVVYDDFISYEIYEESPSGRLTFIFSDCINLDDPYDASGSVHIDTPYIGEDLYISWENRRGAFNLFFESGFSVIHSTSFSTDYFRNGNEVDFQIETDFSEYRVEFSGPFCN